MSNQIWDVNEQMLDAAIRDAGMKQDLSLSVSSRIFGRKWYHAVSYESSTPNGFLVVKFDAGEEYAKREAWNFYDNFKEVSDDPRFIVPTLNEAPISLGNIDGKECHGVLLQLGEVSLMKAGIDSNMLRTEEQRVRAIEHAARGVHKVHTVVKMRHRDIKPHNIILMDSESEEWALGDYGGMKLLGGNRGTTTEAGTTNTYIHPERKIASENEDVYKPTIQDDLWGLGITWLALEYRHEDPICGPDHEAYASHKHIKIAHKRINDLDIPKRNKEMLLRLLNERDKMYGSAEEFLNDLSAPTVSVATPHKRNDEGYESLYARIAKANSIMSNVKRDDRWGTLTHESIEELFNERKEIFEVAGSRFPKDSQAQDIAITAAGKESELYKLMYIDELPILDRAWENATTSDEKLSLIEKAFIAGPPRTCESRKTKGGVQLKGKARYSLDEIRRGDTHLADHYGGRL